MIPKWFLDLARFGEEASTNDAKAPITGPLKGGDIAGGNAGAAAALLSSHHRQSRDRSRPRAAAAGWVGEARPFAKFRRR